MAVADDALTEIFDVAILLSHQGAPGGFPSPACPSSRSPTAPAWCGSSPLAPRPADHSADRPADIRRIVRLACHLPNQAAWDEPRIRFEYELGHQSQGGEGTRPGYPVNAARPRRRGDRITLFAAVQESGPGRYCCKSPKLPRANFSAVKKSDRRPPVDVAQSRYRGSPVSLSSGDEVAHIFTRKSRLRPKEFLITSAKGLLQQNRHLRD